MPLCRGRGLSMVSRVPPLKRRSREPCVRRSSRRIRSSSAFSSGLYACCACGSYCARSGPSGSAMNLYVGGKQDTSYRLGEYPSSSFIVAFDVHFEILRCLLSFLSHKFRWPLSQLGLSLFCGTLRPSNRSILHSAFRGSSNSVNGTRGIPVDIDP